MDDDQPRTGPAGVPARGDAAGDPTPDPLVAARIALAGVDELPLLDRAVVFEQVHATVVEELRQLELG